MAIASVTTLLLGCLLFVWAAPPTGTETQLYPWMNNCGFGSNGDFDQMQNAFALQDNKDYSKISVGTLDFYTQIGQAKDNIIAQGQTIPLRIDSTGALYFLVSSSHGPAPDAQVALHYTDGSMTVSRLDVPDWQVSQLSQVLDRILGLPWRLNNGATGALFAIPVYFDPSKSLRSLKLPNDDRVHVFAIKTSLQKHQAPQWLEDAKFGIFIHWGVYSVPAWSAVGKEYSEWYWWQMGHEPTFSNHRDTYGENFNYDDFIPRLPNTPDPATWLDLVTKANARYFVFTTKHHDGVALWDTSVSQRSTVHMGPKRDFVASLMETAKQPAYAHLKRGLYFSLPEWFHPQYKDDSLGWHGPPKNPYTGKTIEYTNSPVIRDFVNELQVPQAMELIEHHEPDIFWCDIGGINNSSAWQSEFYNQASAKGRQVSVNDRCGNGISDFTTVEYKSNAVAPSRFWEATRGIDPYSFGYNRATKPEQYATTEALVQELVDVVSKGGNLLLNIGPDMNGHVVEPMGTRLIEMGDWIDNAGEDCLFNTTRYWVAPNGVQQQDTRIRFTVAGHALFMFTLDKPPQELVIPVPVPIHSGVTTALGKVKVPWRLDKQGRVVLEITQEALDAGKYVWVFKIS
ncbi:alpha-L-fucosidase-domain-containing protein [Fennellomyces sp. T-0311]|nr:alpha-L-fucosidase-domain-containing protein [Fennellomyces sp. T-0311]